MLARPPFVVEGAGPPRVRSGRRPTNGLLRPVPIRNDEHRQRILLAFEKGEKLNILQIVSTTTLSRTAVTHHLKVLHHANVLSSEKIGKEVYFWINRTVVMEALQSVLSYIKEET